MERTHQHSTLWWVFIAALVLLSGVLGYLQYHWIGAVSHAEQADLRERLEAGLNRVSRQLNTGLTSIAEGVIPATFNPKREDREQAYAVRFQDAKASANGHLVSSLSVGVPVGQNVELRRLDPSTGAFTKADWPQGWSTLRTRLLTRLNPNVRGDAFSGYGSDPAGVIEIPRFDFQTNGLPSGHEVEWVILEYDVDHILKETIPALMLSQMGASEASKYAFEISTGPDSSRVLYRSGEPIGKQADASVNLFDIRMESMFRRTRGGGPRPFPRGDGPKGPPPSDRSAKSERSSPPAPEHGRWTLAVRHHAGSLEAVVAQARMRNLAVTAGIFVLMMFAVGALIQLTRRSHRLADLQMQFVAGVSHELRTPLSVMRTAGHNLRGNMASDPERVKRYGALIEQQAESLGGIVEQVLSFARGRAGSPIGKLEPASVAGLIEEAVKAANCPAEVDVEPGLPPVLADPTALRHALQNLLTNAVKYGRPGERVNVNAELSRNGTSGMVEIRVRDHGDGIPASEMRHIFDPFYRGASVVEKQIHGTGLGLTITRRIIEAHRGTISVKSEPGQGAEFTVRLAAVTAGENS